MTITRLKSYVEGRFVDGTGPGRTLHNPTTGAVLAEASSEGIDFGAALDFARRQGSTALRAMTFEERGQRLAAASKAVHAHRDELLELSTTSGGNTRGDAKFDVDGGTGTMMYYARLGESLGARRFLLDGDMQQLTRTPRYVGQHIRCPLPGVAVHINAFNFPAWGMLEKAAVALLAGMPVVTKPATATAILATRIAEILAEADVLPAGCFSLLAGSAGDLLDHIQTGDAVAFTGSSGVGHIVRSRENVLRGSVRVNVEADSLNAAILGPDVADDADTWDMFLREVAKDMTQKAGQKCTAIRRIFVPREVAEQVGEELSEQLAAVRVGNPALREVRMGPLATAGQLRDVRAGIETLAGACELVHGDGGRGELVDVPEGQGYFVSPVLLRAPESTTAVVHGDEVFGPVATLVPYSGDPAEVAHAVSLGSGGLVSSIYSDDRDFVGEVVTGIAPWNGRITVGSARVAEHSPGPGTVLPQMVHGGPGRAGGGEELGGARGLEFYMQRTAVQGAKPLLMKVLDA